MMSDDSGKSKKLSLSGSRLTLGGLEAGQLRATPGGTGRPVSYTHLTLPTTRHG